VTGTGQYALELPDLGQPGQGYRGGAPYVPASPNMSAVTLGYATHEGTITLSAR
jgi:hypothetical protein